MISEQTVLLQKHAGGMLDLGVMFKRDKNLLIVKYTVKFGIMLTNRISTIITGMPHPYLVSVLKIQTVTNAYQGNVSPLISISFLLCLYFNISIIPVYNTLQRSQCRMLLNA